MPQVSADAVKGRFYKVELTEYERGWGIQALGHLIF